MASSEDEKISQIWRDNKNVSAFSGADIFKKQNPDLVSGAKLLSTHLPSIPTYQKFRIAKKPRAYNPYFVYTKRKIIQSDLLHMQHPPSIIKKNEGYAYILVIQDIFSRKIWARPLKTKAATEVVTNIDNILKEMEPFENKARFVIDRGTEYLNKLVRRVLKKYKLTISHPSDGHASHVERSILSLQRVLYQQMHAANNSLNWISKLPSAVKIMNGRYHRIIKMTPNNAEQDQNANKVNEAMSIYRLKAFRKKKLVKKLNKGDHVRIHKWKNKFSRGYQQNFSTEVFKIDKILDHLPITMYTLKDLKDETITGNFYAEELSIVKGKVYIIDKVLEEKTMKGKKWFLVRWEGFPEKFNSWVKKEDLE
jgi:hypothetical protein